MGMVEFGSERVDLKLSTSFSIALAASLDPRVLIASRSRLPWSLRRAAMGMVEFGSELVDLKR
jgi:hypothetical protein